MLSVIDDERRITFLKALRDNQIPFAVEWIRSKGLQIFSQLIPCTLNRDMLKHDVPQSSLRVSIIQLYCIPGNRLP